MSSSSSSSSPVVTMKAHPVRSLDSDSDSSTSTSTRSRSSNMEMNLVSQSFPAGIISNDVEVDVDIDVDVTDVEKGQERSVTAVAQHHHQQQQQQQDHSVATEEVLSRRGLTTTTTTDEEDEKASFRSRMMLQQKRSPAGMSIHISSLSPNLQQSVRNLHLDVDGDGHLDTEEILSAVKQLTTQTNTHASLRKIVCALCTFLLLLVVCVFFSTITAARLVIDTEVDPRSGIMYAKKGGARTTIMKTEAVAIYSNSTTVAQMTNADLDILKAILPGSGTGGGVKFQVKGYARKMGSSEDEVRVLVEGGTITYDSQGIKDATGNAKVLLTFAYGDLLVDSPSSTHYLYGPTDVYVSGG